MDILALIIAFALVGLNAFFVATEFAIVKVRPTRIEELIRKQRPGASATRQIVSNIDAYLSATQLGITIASLGLGMLGEPAFARLVEPVLTRMGIMDPNWVHRVALAGAFFIITFLHIVLGELAPKSLAILKAESVAIAVAYPMRLFFILFFPFIWILNHFANLVLRVAGIRTPIISDETHSEEEIKIIVAQARSAGLLSASRSEVLRKAMTLPSKSAKYLMVPRNEVVFLDINVDVEENIKRAMESQHTRFPLCDRELDDVIGVVDIREVLYRSRSENVNLTELSTPPVYLPELMSGERLLAEFRSRPIPLAIIVDEYGGTSGMVTAADVVSAVMGEFEDDDENEVVALPGGVYDVEGTAPLEEVEEALQVTIGSDGMRTVAGFLMEKLERMPRAGDQVIAANHVFHVLAVNGPRIQKVRIRRHKKATTLSPARSQNEITSS